MVYISNLNEIQVSREALELMTEAVAIAHSVLPVSVNETELHCIFPDLDGSVNLDILETIRFAANRRVTYDTANRRDLDRVINLHYRTFYGAEIQNCELKSRCPKEWSRISGTDDPFVRYCEVCQQNVFFCTATWECKDRTRKSERIAYGLLYVYEFPGLPVEFVDNAEPSSREESRHSSEHQE